MRKQPPCKMEAWGNSSIADSKDVIVVVVVAGCWCRWLWVVGCWSLVAGRWLLVVVCCCNFKQFHSTMMHCLMSIIDTHMNDIQASDKKERDEHPSDCCFSISYQHGNEQEAQG